MRLPSMVTTCAVPALPPDVRRGLRPRRYVEFKGLGCALGANGA
jgi:hypothetical protein